MGGNHTVPALLVAAALVLAPTAAAGTSVSLYTTLGEVSITIDSPDPEEEEEACRPNCDFTVLGSSASVTVDGTEVAVTANADEVLVLLPGDDPEEEEGQPCDPHC